MRGVAFEVKLWVMPRVRDAIGSVVRWAANKAPRQLVYWCAIRLMVNATTGIHSRQSVPELTAADALKRWDNRTGGDFDRNAEPEAPTEDSIPSPVPAADPVADARAVLIAALREPEPGGLRPLYLATVEGVLHESAAGAAPERVAADIIDRLFPMED